MVHSCRSSLRPTPEVALELYGGEPHRDAERRRRRVDALLEARGLRPRSTW